MPLGAWLTACPACYTRAMSQPIPLRCRCGAVRALAHDISSSNSSRSVCHCVDCQAYARFLNVEGLVDAHGGTAVFQAAPAQLQFTQGAEQLTCMRLGPKGLLRWYTKCCRTPVGNMLANAGVPLVTVPEAFVDGASKSQLEAVGKPVGIKGLSAVGGVPPGVHPNLPFGPIAGILLRVVRAKLAGKARPSPFFNEAGQPRVAPQVLTREERTALR